MLHYLEAALLYQAAAAAGHLGGLVVGLVDLQQAHLPQQLLAVREQVGEAAGLLPAADAAERVRQAGRLREAAPGEVPIAGDQLIPVVGPAMFHQQRVALEIQ